MYSTEPKNKKLFTQTNNQLYSRLSKAYDIAVKVFPVWKHWISTAIPHIVGPNVLEVSFGTGYLLSKYADKFNTFGIDYNWELACIAQKNLISNHVQAAIQQADIEYLPYKSGIFDSVVNTMAFTGYPNGLSALLEIKRVLKSKGRFILVDIDFPRNQNWLGTLMTRTWIRFGDILRDLEALFEKTGFHSFHEEVGGFGSVHLYIATKK